MFKLTRPRMDEHYNDIDIQIAKFLAGEATPEEAMRLLDWVDESDANKKYFEQTEAAWMMNLTPYSKPDAQEVFKSLPLTKNKKHVWFSAIRIAAVFLVLILFGYGLYSLYFNSAHHDDDLVFKLSEQQSLNFKLPEGSAITMNKESLIRHSKSFSEKRKIYLAGEAFFEVTPDPEKPFTVGTDDVVITVLGTAFNVSAYDADSLVQVQVVHGKVLMNHANDSLILIAGEKGFYNKVTEKLWREKAQTNNSVAYATHTLTYADKSLDHVLEDLEKAYHVTFEIENPKVRNCRLTGEYHSMELGVILEVISKSLDLTYTINGNRVYISGDGCL